jgi:hypothetical protein
VLLFKKLTKLNMQQILRGFMCNTIASIENLKQMAIFLAPLLLI